MPQDGSNEPDDDVSSQSNAADLMFGDEGKPTDSELQSYRVL